MSSKLDVCKGWLETALREQFPEASDARIADAMEEAIAADPVLRGDETVLDMYCQNPETFFTKAEVVGAAVLETPVPTPEELLEQYMAINPHMRAQEGIEKWREVSAMSEKERVQTGAELHKIRPHSLNENKPAQSRAPEPEKKKTGSEEKTTTPTKAETAEWSSRMRLNAQRAAETENSTRIEDGRQLAHLTKQDPAALTAAQRLQKHRLEQALRTK